MNLFRLLHELHKHKASISITQRNTLAVDYEHELTDEIRAAIRQHKQPLFEIYSSCRHCGKKLTIKIARTWFEAKCPDVPCHFLIEEHEHSLGHSVANDYLQSILPEIEFSPEDWLTMQCEIEREALILQNDLGIPQDEAITPAKELALKRFALRANESISGVREEESSANSDYKKSPTIPVLKLTEIEQNNNENSWWTKCPP